MNPPGAGRPPSGAQSSMSNFQSGDLQSQRQAGVFEFGQDERAASQNPALLDTSSSSDPWFFAPQSQPSHQRQSPQRQPPPPAPMIGPTSTFFDAEVSSHQSTDAYAQQYRDWADSFGSQRQPVQSQAHQAHRPTVAQNQPQGQYAFSAGRYVPGDASSQYSHSTAGTVTQENMGTSSFPESSAGFNAQGMDVYAHFYDQVLAAEARVPSAPSRPNVVPNSQQLYPQRPSPDSTLHSYTSTPDPTFHRPQPGHPQQQEAYPATGQLHPGAHTQAQQQPSHVPRQRIQPTQPSGSMSFPQFTQPQQYRNPSSTHSNQSGSSHSPKSWTEDVLSAQPSPRATQVTQRPTPSVGEAPVTTSSKPSGSAPGKQAPTSGGSAHPQNVVAAPKVERKRKRTRKDEEGQWSVPGVSPASDSESDDELGGGYRVGMGGLGIVSRAGRPSARLPGACKHCKKLKMKCDFPKGEDTCRRCLSTGHVCVVEGRKPRTAPNKREYLLAQIRQKDEIIESLLKQLHNPYLATPLSIESYRMATSPSDKNKGNVLAWLDRLQSSVRDAGSKAGPSVFSSPRGQRDHQGESDIESENDEAPEGNGDEEDEASSEDKLQQSSLPDSHVPLGLIANLSLTHSKKAKKKNKDATKDPLGVSEEDLNDDNVGVANETYFMPGPATDLGIRAKLIEQHSPPEILVHGLVTPEQVEKLFDLFYEHVNPFISLLDRALHTPASTFARCPFLFTVVCAIASRYFTEKSEIYPIAMHFAKHSAATALIDGWKSVELCQAYILMSIYAVPARRWEEDRSWLYTGLAIRIATDLNLHQVPTAKITSEKQEREILNKTRVWMICFNLDRSTATQFGKPSTIKEDYTSVLRNAKDWYRKSKYRHPYDIHLCGYSTLLQIVTKFHDQVFSDPTSPTGLNKRVDFRSVTLEHDVYLTEFHTEWSKRFAEESDPNDPGCAFRCTLLPFLVAYSRLVMFSFGFQQAYQRGLQQNDHIFFTKCLESAKTVIETMIDTLAPSGYMKYAPDGHFVFATFASAFLLKLLRPEFSKLLTKDQENDIFDLIGRLIQTLSSGRIAIDDRHTPKLYARFLACLLSRHRRDGATVGRLQTLPPPNQPASVPMNAPGGSMTTFSLTGQPGQPTPGAGGSGGGGGGGAGGGYSIDVTFPQQHMEMDTPIYMPEATFATGAGQISFGTAGIEGYASSEDELLAPMQALRNPNWWQDLMMPGFAWPEATPSPPAAYQQPAPAAPPPQQPGYSNHPIATTMPGLTGTFGMFHSTQIPLH